MENSAQSPMPMVQFCQMEAARRLPGWVPEAVVTYVAHVDAGQTLRSLARDRGCHASTILRQVRRTEQRRDDLLVDHALDRIGRSATTRPETPAEEPDAMTTTVIETENDTVIDDATLDREARRVLRRLNEPGACLALAKEMEKAVVARDAADGRTLRTAVVDRPVAEALALKDWIAPTGEGGRIIRYRITQTGRIALKRMMAEDEARRATEPTGSDSYGDQHRTYDTREVPGEGRRKVRYSIAESPLTLLARRKDKEGRPFLGADLVSAGERLREDFELAQMGPRTTQNWERFLTAGGRGDFGASDPIGGGSDAARRRVSEALSELGPGLGDVVLRCCCFLEGMESVERRMGWSARSGKIVLRIALTRLKRHYDSREGGWSPLIG